MCLNNKKKMELTLLPIVKPNTQVPLDNKASSYGSTH